VEYSLSPGHEGGGSSSSSSSSSSAAASFTDATKGFERTPVADLFFSSVNVDALQEGIRWRVYVDSGHKKYTISRQSDRELYIIMRSVYLQNSLNAPSDVVAQVRDLNAIVISFCVPRIVNEVDMYREYQQSLSRLPEPMSRGEMVTNKGSRVLEGRL
jgi:hypothetical protein